MAMVSSYETTMVSAIVDVFGHVLVVNQSEESVPLEKIQRRIMSIRPDVTGITPFINFEGIVVGQGKLNGVVAQGVDPETVDRVLRLRPRIVRGAFSLGENRAIVGKELARRYGLEIGSELKLVLPRPLAQETSGFESKVARFTVSGIIDLGKYDYDERTVITSIDDARKVLGISAPFVGLRLKLADEKNTFEARTDFKRQLGEDWWVSDWTEGNRNILRAIKYERVPIFLVIFIMVIAASFNVSSNIFIGVLRRTMDLSVLRALGLSARDVAWIFRVQGALFGLIGMLLGFVLGGVLGGVFVLAQRYFVILPPDVYKISHVGVEFHVLDAVAIAVAAVLICLVAALAPAAKAAKLVPVEGLRHE
jgi:lipoprotein-releasing system permease protein